MPLCLSSEDEIGRMVLPPRRVRSMARPAEARRFDCQGAMCYSPSEGLFLLLFPDIYRIFRTKFRSPHKIKIAGTRLETVIHRKER